MEKGLYYTTAAIELFSYITKNTYLIYTSVSDTARRYIYIKLHCINL